MKRYKDLNTGEIWTEDELRDALREQARDFKNGAPPFEEYLENSIWRGRGDVNGYLAEIHHYVVWMTDANGATSPIDTVDAPEGYTATDYYWACDDNADADWIAMLDAATEIRLEEVKE